MINTVKEKKFNIWIEVALCCFVLISMLLFFEIAHPLVILDADDWTYISASRIAIPATKFWNPARIFPEILMPYASSLGVLLFSKFGYIPSITVMNGLVLSLFITAYVRELYALLTQKLDLRYDAAALCACLFLLFHFTIFRTRTDGNNYLFRANNVTCVYYYIIPGILNCTLMMFLIRTDVNKTFLERENQLQKGVLVLVVYLAVFSNLFESIILAAYCGMDFVFGFFKVPRKSKETIKGQKLLALKEQAFNVSVIVLWLVSLWFEGQGGRGQYANNQALGQSMKQTITAFTQCLRSNYINRLLLFFISATTVLFIVVSIKNRHEEQTRKGGKALSVIVLSAVCVLLFELLLCAKVSPYYITRSDTLFGVYFALLAISIILLAICIKQYPKLILLLPLLLLVFYSETNTFTRTFYEGNALTLSADLCTQLDDDIIEQIKEADRNGKSYVTVYVIKCNSQDNWPFSLYMGDRIASSLFKHGVTGKLMNITIEADPKLNMEYHLLW